MVVQSSIIWLVILRSISQQSWIWQNTALIGAGTSIRYLQFHSWCPHWGVQQAWWKHAKHGFIWTFLAASWCIMGSFWSASNSFWGSKHGIASRWRWVRQLGINVWILCRKFAGVKNVMIYDYNPTDIPLSMSINVQSHLHNSWSRLFQIFVFPAYSSREGGAVVFYCAWGRKPLWNIVRI